MNGHEVYTIKRRTNQTIGSLNITYLLLITAITDHENMKSFVNFKYQNCNLPTAGFVASY